MLKGWTIWAYSSNNEGLAFYYWKLEATYKRHRIIPYVFTAIFDL